MLSKPWDWTKANEDVWLIPTNEFYYYKQRWSDIGFKTILDLGCGKGRHAIAFAEAGFDTFAGDLSPLAVEITKENALRHGVNIDVKEFDILDLPYENDKFDAIFAYHVISHTDTEGLKRAIEEVTRVLKKGGEIFLDLVSKESGLFKRARKFIDKNTFIMEEIDAENGLPHCCVGADDIRRLFKGYEILDVKLRFSIDMQTNEKFGGHYFIHALKRR